jgi:hypothetical protein
MCIGRRRHIAAMGVEAGGIVEGVPGTREGERRETNAARNDPRLGRAAPEKPKTPCRIR